MTRLAYRWLLLSLFTAMFGCARLPVNNDIPKPLMGRFSHQLFDEVLQQVVDDQGRVNYAALKQNPEDFDTYYQLLNYYSPDSHPNLFITNQERLAYWLNAYNASVIKLVLHYYPIRSVTEVDSPVAWFFLPDKWRFFLLNRFQLGQHETSLYALENLIRERFSDPRVHFALNCASLGCPKLPRQAFTGEHLDQQLNQAAQKFFSEPRNLRIDGQTRTVYLSAIMDWYESDFLTEYQRLYPLQNDNNLLAIVAYYAAPELQQRLRGEASAYKLNFVTYDWGLNDVAQP